MKTETITNLIAADLISEEPDLDQEIVWRDTEPERQGRFVVDDPRRAEWALRKIAAHKATMAANTELVTAEIDAIEAEVKRLMERLAEMNSKPERQASYLESLLAEYHLAELRKDPDRKTIKLPAGTLKARPLPFQLEIDDERLIKWAQVHDAPHLVREKTEVARDALRKAIDMERVRDDGTAVTADGEVIEGVTVTPGGLKFSVVTEIES